MYFCFFLLIRLCCKNYYVHLSVESFEIFVNPLNLSRSSRHILFFLGESIGCVFKSWIGVHTNNSRSKYNSQAQSHKHIISTKRRRRARAKIAIFKSVTGCIGFSYKIIKHYPYIKFSFRLTKSYIYLITSTVPYYLFCSD